MPHQIISHNNSLHIIDEDAFPVCHLDAETLQELIHSEDAVCSGCLIHLASGSLLPTDVLYNVAILIQRRFPHLQIDWFSTFYIVEKIHYLKLAFHMKEMLECDVATGDEEQRWRSFEEFSTDEMRDETDKLVHRIVIMNLVDFDVLSQ